MIGRMLVLALTLSMGTVVYGQCAGADTEARKGLDEIHWAQLRDIRETEAAVDGWLPETLRQIRLAAPDRDWYHLAILIARELNRYDRRDEAREVLELVAKGQPKVAGRMRVVALKELAKLDQQAAH